MVKKFYPLVEAHRAEARGGGEAERAARVRRKVVLEQATRERVAVRARVVVVVVRVHVVVVVVVVVVVAAAAPYQFAWLVVSPYGTSICPSYKSPRQSHCPSVAR